MISEDFEEQPLVTSHAHSQAHKLVYTFVRSCALAKELTAECLSLLGDCCQLEKNMIILMILEKLF